MIVLKIIGWILLSVIALIIIALSIRIRIDAEYSSENTSVILKYLFLKIKLYPMQKKEKKDDKKNAEAASEERSSDKESSESEESTSEQETNAENKETDSQKQGPSDNDGTGEEVPAETTETGKEEKKKDSFLKTFYQAEGVDGIITIIKKVFSYLKTFTGNLFRTVVVDELFLEICCTRSDAASTAIYYGEVCSTVFPMLGSLASKCRIKKYNVNIYPDYLARFSSASFFVSIHFTPIYVLGITLALGLKMIFGVLLGIIVKIILPKKDKKKQDIQIKSTEKSESK